VSASSAGRFLIAQTLRLAEIAEGMSHPPLASSSCGAGGRDEAPGDPCEIFTCIDSKWP
jgi:hypothetical protein